MDPGLERARLVALALALSMLGCVPSGMPRLIPSRVTAMDSDRVTLRVVGLEPNQYLEASLGRVRVADDLRVQVGGVDAEVLGASGAGIEVRLTRGLTIGVYELRVRARARDLHVPNALEVVAFDTDAGSLDAGSLEVGTDASAPDVSALPPLCPSDPALVACWPLDGDSLDSSGRGNHLNASGVTFPAGGGAELATPSALFCMARPELRHASMGFDAWFRLDVMPPLGGRAALVDHQGQFGIFVSRSLDLTCSAGTSRTGTPNPVTLGRWHHAACVTDAGQLSLYIDGVLVQTTPATGGAVLDEPLHLGENSPDGSDQWVGAIDDARLWDRPLTAAEIVQTFTIGRRLE